MVDRFPFRGPYSPGRIPRVVLGATLAGATLAGATRQRCGLVPPGVQSTLIAQPSTRLRTTENTEEAYKHVR
jgi:hypothetical protein